MSFFLSTKYKVIFNCCKAIIYLLYKISYYTLKVNRLFIGKKMFYLILIYIFYQCSFFLDNFFTNVQRQIFMGTKNYSSFFFSLRPVHLQRAITRKLLVNYYTVSSKIRANSSILHFPCVRCQNLSNLIIKTAIFGFFSFFH